MILQLRRTSFETDIEIKINLFGNGFFKVKTFIFFFDHILSQTINYSFFDCYLRCYSDLKIDSHHVIEDTGISLGFLLKNKLLNRYNSFFLSMDDSFIMMTLDICNRIFYFDNFFFLDYDLQLIREFFFSFVKKINCNFYIYIINFFNKHHLIESIFKLFGIILKKSKSQNKIISTKGYL